MRKTKFHVMKGLIVFIKPMLLPMFFAILLGVLGHLSAISITVLGSYGLINLLNQSFDLTLILVFMIVCALIRGILRYGEQACNHYIAFKLLAHIRDKVFGVLRKLAPAKLEGKEKGSLISLITSDIELLEVFFAHTISPVMIALIVSLIMVLFIGHYHFILGMIALIAYLTVGVLLPFAASKQSGNCANEFRKANSQLNNHVLESLYGFHVTLQFENQSERLTQLDALSEEMLKKEKQLKEVTAKNSARSGLAVQGFSILMLIGGLMLYVHGLSDFETVLIPFFALFSSFGPVMALANLGSSLQPTLAAGERVLNLLDEEPLIEEVTDGMNVSFENASLQDVCFSYEETPILNHISLEFPKDKIIGIQGKSGSGKSTLLKLLMRFWDVNSGKIEISSQDIRQINTHSLRELESYMTQDTYLFHDTIENNIRIAKPDATIEEIQMACQKAAIHDFIMSLENGYQSVVGERGTTLSGGERQRIGMARAFLHDADFILLDEPSSNLDSLNEAILLHSIKKESEHKTVVFVSHRASTLRIADEIIHMESGRAS